MNNNDNIIKYFDIPEKYLIIDIKSSNNSNKQIYQVKNKENDNKYILIKYPIHLLSELEKNEIRIYSCLPFNENLLHCYEIIKNTDNIYLIIDNIENSNLNIFINQNKGQLSEKLIWNYLIQMLYSLYFLHNCQIIHNNIKTSNFFLFENNLIKLGGFNFCEYNNEKLEYIKNTKDDNYFYSSPEIINQQNYSYNSDIYSLGLCIYEMCFDINEYYQNKIEFLNKILKGELHPINENKYSDDLFQIIKNMLKIDKNERPNVEQILNDSIILNHIYNPHKYLDVLTFYPEIKGFQFLNELNLNILINEKKYLIGLNNENKLNQNQVINYNIINKNINKYYNSIISKNDDNDFLIISYNNLNNQTNYKSSEFDYNNYFDNKLLNRLDSDINIKNINEINKNNQKILNKRSNSFVSNKNNNNNNNNLINNKAKSKTDLKKIKNEHNKKNNNIQFIDKNIFLKKIKDSELKKFNNNKIVNIHINNKIFNKRNNNNFINQPLTLNKKNSLEFKSKFYQTQISKNSPFNLIENLLNNKDKNKKLSSLNVNKKIKYKKIIKE